MAEVERSAHGPRVVVVNYAFDPRLSDPEATLDAFATLRLWAKGLCAAGLAVAVVQRHQRDAAVSRDGIEYRFVAAGRSPRPRTWQPAPAVALAVAELCPDLAHVNGLLFPLQTRLLRRRLRPGTAIVVQNHAESPRRGWRGSLQRWGHAEVDGFLFTAAAQAEPWLARGVVREPDLVFEVMEGATEMGPEVAPSDHVRLEGSPALLWVGRLQAVKDPLTLLDGLELLLGHAPAAHLTMVFGEDELLDAVRAKLAGSARLRRAVTMTGAVPHRELGLYYAGADYFVAASLREGSGFALAEALSFGLVPIVTDIPSFAKMTDGGRFGGLWRPGDAADFARVAKRVFSQPRFERSRAARAHFERYLDADAIGRRARAIYETVLARRRGRGR